MACTGNEGGEALASCNDCDGLGQIVERTLLSLIMFATFGSSSPMLFNLESVELA